ncbi:hypothetical protein LZU85_04150 [Vibrio sp. IRLE0018]|uniref:hypothetical protein n=1 Tax=Vibrio TaxID=662 RepID=UPI0015930960|nr:MULTISPECIES: hypothetical protein [Vibrio]MCF8777984.1 hypothetical protein [Vibrio floridensis]NVC64879.1 hypothetical protein [Vibrio sp. 05-20-BW147]HAS6347140.1 hypothetical protein [Vibrio vulnificus]
MNIYKKIELNEDTRCPLCQHDEYFISSDGEKFTCASCGFHTKSLSAIRCLQMAPIYKSRPVYVHSATNAYH